MATILSEFQAVTPYFFRCSRREHAYSYIRNYDTNSNFLGSLEQGTVSLLGVVCMNFHVTSRMHWGEKTGSHTFIGNTKTRTKKGVQKSITVCDLLYYSSSWKLFCAAVSVNELALATGKRNRLSLLDHALEEETLFRSVS